MHDKPVRLGLVGCGGRGRYLFEVCGASPEVELAAVCDVNPNAAQPLLLKHPRLRSFGDAEALFASGLVNTVLIVTPPQSHAPCAVAALDRKLHVFSDVPAAHDLEQARALYEATQRASTLYMFGENVNYWAFVEEATKLRREGRLGDPVYLEAEYVHELGDLVTATPWRRTYEPIRYCTHSLGPILAWIAEELVSVACFATGRRGPGQSEADDAMVALFHSASGAVVKVLCTFGNRHPFHFHRYVYYGTRGYFERSSPRADGKQETLFASGESESPRALTVLPVDFARPGAEGGGHGGADERMMRDFVAAIVGRQPPPIDIKAGLRMTVPGLYALESARRGGALLNIRYPWSE